MTFSRWKLARCWLRRWQVGFAWISVAVLTLVSSTGCSSETSLPALVLAEIQPPEVSEAQSQRVRILGEGFHLRLDVDLDKSKVTSGDIMAELNGQTLTGIALVSESVIEATVPSGFTAGTKQLRVVFPDGREATLADAFAVVRPCIDVSECATSDPCTVATGCEQGQCVYADNGASRDFFHDADGDGYTNTGDVMTTCVDPDGDGTEWVATPTVQDCADMAGSDPNCGGEDGALCSPGLTEGPSGDPTCSDGVDNDCNGDADDADAVCACSEDCTGCSGATCCLVQCPGGDCSPNCQLGCDCVLDCGGTTGACTPSCSNDSSCAIDCAGVNNCTASCGPRSMCSLDCRGTNNCGISCSNGSACDVDCTDANNCEDVFCGPGAACLIDCESATNCSFGSCGDTVQSCPNDIIVCGRPCP